MPAPAALAVAQPRVQSALCLTPWPSLRSALSRCGAGCCARSPGLVTPRGQGRRPSCWRPRGGSSLPSWVSGTQHWAGRARATAWPPGASPGAARGVDPRGTHASQRRRALKFCESIHYTLLLNYFTENQRGLFIQV